MATFTQTLSLGNGATVTITFDDVTFKMTRIAWNNPSEKPCVFSMTEPIVVTIACPASDSGSLNIPTAQRPSWSWGTITGKTINNQWISGIGFNFG